MPLKMSYGTSVKPLPHSVEISRVGNLMCLKLGMWSILINVLFQETPKLLLEKT